MRIGVGAKGKRLGTVALALSPERVNDFETPAERIECRGVVQVCEWLADFRVG